MMAVRLADQDVCVASMSSYAAAMSTSLSMDIHSLKSEPVTDFMHGRDEAKIIEALSGGEWDEGMALVPSFRGTREPWDMILASDAPTDTHMNG
mgnify:CR=1 FL=1